MFREYVCAESIFVVMEPSQSKLEPWISKLSNIKKCNFSSKHNSGAKTRQNQRKETN